MRAAGEALEHLLCFFGAARLAVDPPVEDDLGVAAEDRTPVRLGEHRSRLAERVGDGILLGFVVLGSDDVERDPELLEDLATPRRGRR